MSGRCSSIVRPSPSFSSYLFGFWLFVERSAHLTWGLHLITRPSDAQNKVSVIPCWSLFAFLFFSFFFLPTRAFESEVRALVPPSSNYSIPIGSKTSNFFLVSFFHSLVLRSFSLSILIGLTEFFSPNFGFQMEALHHFVF